ncbi:hypothetical protein N8524_06375 [Candidatus Puniceispirillum sp.]|nr:hypothetical protein [Candidatus Puniceispirillum sp.]
MRILVTLATIIASHTTVWAGERIKCDWNEQTVVMVGGEASPLEANEESWTIYEFLDSGGVSVIDTDGSESDLVEEKIFHEALTWSSAQTTEIGSGIVNIDGANIGVTVSIGKLNAVAAMAGLIDGSTFFSGVEATCSPSQ